MKYTDNHTIGRRPVLKAAGTSVAALGGFSTPALAQNEPTPLSDRAADILVYWSQVNEDRNDPDEAGDFDFLEKDADPLPPGGLTFAGHDPPGGDGLNDFSRIVMYPNGDLENTAWLILGGAVMASEPTSYKLEHLGDGLYRSRGQQMKFEARPADEILAILNEANPEITQLPPAVARLAGGKWFAFGNEFAQLGLDDDEEPDPSQPEWGVTRIDFYEHPGRSYGLSFLYLIGADDAGTGDPTDGIPQAAYAMGSQLIAGGRAVPGSRRHGGNDDDDAEKSRRDDEGDDRKGGRDRNRGGGLDRDKGGGDGRKGGRGGGRGR